MGVGCVGYEFSGSFSDSKKGALADFPPAYCLRLRKLMFLMHTELK